MLDKEKGIERQGDETGRGIVWDGTRTRDQEGGEVNVEAEEWTRFGVRLTKGATRASRTRLEGEEENT